MNSRTLLRLRDLRFTATIGVHPWESEPRQITMHLELTLRPHCAIRAIQTDRLRETVDYTEAENRIAELLAARPFQLLESMADAVARLLLSFPQLGHVRVEIEKPGALRFAPMVAIVHEASHS